MPALINSAPECVTTVDGAKPADDSADFIIQAAFEDCAGIMTFGPGSTYGDEGAAADTAYYILTVLGNRGHRSGPDRLDRVREPAPAGLFPRGPPRRRPPRGRPARSSR